MSDPSQTTESAELAALKARDRGARRFHLIMAVMAVMLTACDLVVARIAHVGTHEYFLGAAYSLLLLGIALGYSRWRRLTRLVDASELLMWAVVFTSVLSVLIQLAGRSPRPLIDDRLSRLDAVLHFKTAVAVQLVARVPAIRKALVFSYELAGPLIIVSVMLPPLLGYANASRRYMLGIVLGLVVVAGIFSIWPAAGPWTTEGFAPTAEQAAVTSYLARLKSPEPATLDMDDAGIVAFPSFHVLLAILTAAALSAIPGLRAPAWALAILAGIATLTTGWHYLVDVLGGIVLAVLLLCVVNFLLPSGRRIECAASQTGDS